MDIFTEKNFGLRPIILVEMFFHHIQAVEKKLDEVAENEKLNRKGEHVYL